MNISNGFLVRKTDWQIKCEENLQKNSINNDQDLNIDEFNNMQKRLVSTTMLYRNFNHNYFCDVYK